MVDRFALQNDGPDWRMGTCCTIKSLFLIQNVDAMKLSVYIYNNAKTTCHLQQKLFWFCEILQSVSSFQILFRKTCVYLHISGWHFIFLHCLSQFLHCQ